MKLNIEIQGQGSATGNGEYTVGDVATLRGVADTGALFSHFQIGDLKITANPYTFNVLSDIDVSFFAVFIVTIESYLRASVGFELPDLALLKIRLDRGLRFGQDANSLSTQLRELSYADCLYYGSTMPSSIQGDKDSDNGWSHQKGSSTLSITDKRAMRKEAFAIYRKYRDKTIEPTVKLITLNGGKSDVGSRY